MAALVEQQLERHCIKWRTSEGLVISPSGYRRTQEASAGKGAGVGGGQVIPPSGHRGTQEDCKEQEWEWEEDKSSLL